MSVELRLLITCARLHLTREDEAAIRASLMDGVDWTRFARKAIAHGLAGLVGHTIIRVAHDLAPDDILDAFRTTIDHTRKRNRVLFDDLAGAVGALAESGIEAIPLRGPILAIQAFGDLGLRVCADLDLLVRDPDMGRTIATLRSIGYEHQERLTAAQFEPIHRVAEREVVLKRADGNAISLHTRLAPLATALRIDHAAIWRRAQRATLQGRTMLTLAPADDLLALAVHGGKESWRNIKWACDVAALIGSHPKLDWSAVVERAGAQRCRRMLLLATSLARNFFNSAVPEAIAAAELADTAIEPMVRRILARWQADESIERPGSKALSMEWPRLQDGVALRTYRRLFAHAGRLRKALAGSDLAFAMMSALAEAKPSVKWHLKERTDAKRALAADANDEAAWRELGDALSGLERYEQAIACYDKALALAPENRALWWRRSAAMTAIGDRFDPTNFTLFPQDASGWAMGAGALLHSQRFAEAAAASDRALRVDPGLVAAERVGIHARNYSCDWSQREEDKQRITEGSSAGQRLIPPFFYRMICDSEAESLVVARLWAPKVPRSPGLLWRGERYRHKKIRIAYICAEFREHAVAILVAGVFEHHDKARFETTAISLGPDDKSEMRRRIEAAFDHFIAAREKTDAEIGTLLRELEIDILIDLNGFAGAWRRTGILALRPVPVQVSYVGYTGTMGTPFIDYVIGDRVVIPAEQQIHYDEKVVYLPHSYLPADNKRGIGERTPSRIEEELPETGFVFACFNHTYKIAPQMFDVWMRVLRAVESSVLWLRFTNFASMRNLRQEAAARGVTPERLVFAPRKAPAEHLARHRLADLFLDTLPYNAHTTASDALWAGLPVLTCLGNSFPGRVAASLLRAIGLPELVTASLNEYEALARTLAQDPARLTAIRQKLARNRDTAPLFDTARTTRDLETAYAIMWERAQRGEPPEPFSVASAPEPAEKLNAW
jgi:protein O-GlcNAc transferase